MGKVAAAFVGLVVAVSTVFGSTAVDAGALATSDGDTIDLASGWGDARACLELDGSVTCYPSEKDMLNAYAAGSSTQQSSLADGPAVITSTCSSSLRLYDGTGFTGTVLMLTTRLTALNLSTYGFDNQTSSYRVGACATSLYSGSNLGGSLYPGSTGANASASSMVSGWDNVISSVWIS